MNIGDLLSPYLVREISARNVHRAHTSIFPRLLGLGSILGAATAKDYVWGSGFISPNISNLTINPRRVYAVRGKATRDLLAKNKILTQDLPLGDPALLMPRYFYPKVKVVSGRIGIVPHYVDYKVMSEMLVGTGSELHLIDVRREPELFISDLLSCQFVFSSSLHGLILADTYQIPNLWIRISNKIVGGDWKFNDYFSTTDFPEKQVYCIKERQDIEHLAMLADRVCQISRFLESAEDLLDSFPRKFINDAI